MALHLIQKILNYYQAPFETDKQSYDKVYVLGFEDNTEVMLVQDKEGWLHLMADIVVDDLKREQQWQIIANFNDINLTHPIYILGMDPQKDRMNLHCHYPGGSLNNVQLIEHFEAFVDKLTVLKTHFQQLAKGGQRG